MLDRLDATMRFQQEALRLRAQRQEVLSANIAHGDTPHFKARDFDFGAALAQAVGRDAGAEGGASLALTSVRHLPAQAAGGGAADLLYRTPLQSSLDGNTVEMDVERVNFAGNALGYEANLQVLGAKIKSLLAVVQ